MPVFPPEADLLPQVMQIAAGAVDNLPENPQLRSTAITRCIPSMYNEKLKKLSKAAKQS